MKPRTLVISCVALLFIFFTQIVKAQHIEILQSGKPTSIRGLSVVNDNVAWLSGSKGYVALTTDAGKNWQWQQVKGFELSDFRSIVGFSDKKAMIMSSGTPALILKTTDGGKTWAEKYRNTDTAYFFDAMDFADTKHGFILGDPVNNKFLLMKTKDGGETWAESPNRPSAQPSEAAFAASSTCLRVTRQGVYIVSGGPAANLFILSKENKLWNITPIPIAKGQSSKGAFSIAQNDNLIVVVGGDYAHDKQNDSTACYSIDKGKSWQLAGSYPPGYQSCVEYISASTFLSTGTPGTNISYDGGKTLSKIDGNSFNVCRKAKHSTLVLLAGNNGKIGILKP